MNRQRQLGFAILGAVVAVLIGWIFLQPDPDPTPDVASFDGDQITVKGYAGNTKIPLLHDPDVVRILHDTYGLTVEAEGAATIVMLCDFDLTEKDFLWAGDQSQISIYEKCRNSSDPFQNALLNPIVIYSWADTVDALIAAGVVQVSADGVHTVDMAGLLALIDSGATWTDLGFENRPSRIMVQATDPKESNSGRMFSGMLANTMNCVAVVTAETVKPLLPGIHDYFEVLGFLETSSLALFENYLTIGEGGYPLVALPESQITDFLTANPDAKQQVGDDLRILYPEPTVWITHPVIALSDGGKRLLAAVQDPEIQQIAWERYGFRPAVPGIPIDVAVLPVPGVPQEVESVIDLPSDAVMETIVAAILESPPQSAMSPPVCEASTDSNQPAANASPVATPP